MLLLSTQRWQTAIFVLWMQSRMGLAPGVSWCLRGGCSGRYVCMGDADVRWWCFQMLLQKTQEVKLEKGCESWFFFPHCCWSPPIGLRNPVGMQMPSVRMISLGCQVILCRHILTAWDAEVILILGFGQQNYKQTNFSHLLPLFKTWFMVPVFFSLPQLL